MSTFNNFQLYQDFIVLNNITCFQHNVNTIKRKHIVAVEKTKIYSLPWLIFGIFLISIGLRRDADIFILGVIVTMYQFISMCNTVVLIRVPGYSYSSRYCISNDYETLAQWFNNVHDSNIQMATV